MPFKLGFFLGRYSNIGTCMQDMHGRGRPPGTWSTRRAHCWHDACPRCVHVDREVYDALGPPMVRRGRSRLAVRSCCGSIPPPKPIPVAARCGRLVGNPIITSESAVVWSEGRTSPLVDQAANIPVHSRPAGKHFLATHMKVAKSFVTSSAASPTGTLLCWHERAYHSERVSRSRRAEFGGE